VQEELSPLRRLHQAAGEGASHSRAEDRQEDRAMEEAAAEADHRGPSRD
jgi:hypothetical protein